MQAEDDESDFVYGLMLLLRNRLDESEAHFNKEAERDGHESTTSKRIRGVYGLALVGVIRALISFQDDEKNQALERLQRVHKLVQSRLSSNASLWKFTPFGNGVTDQMALENLEVELIAADAGLFASVLQFTQESTMGFVRGSLSLRKACKTYQRAHHLIDTECRSANSNSASNCLNSTTYRFTSTEVIEHAEEMYFDVSPTNEDMLGGATNNGYGPLVSPGASLVDRIRASSELGNGLFHLVFSMIPHRVASMLGTAMGLETSADRKRGLALLQSCVQQGTSRAPLACLALLGFHSAMLIIARGISDDANSSLASAVLNICQRQYPDSPLFRFFEGRLHRSNANLSDAINAFQVSQKFSGSVKTLIHLCMCKTLLELMQGTDNRLHR